MTQTDTPPIVATTVQRYLTFWNAGPGPEQQRLAARVFREDVDHRGPRSAGIGVDQVLQLSAGLAEHLGDIAFRARAEPAAHHDRIRLQWEVLRAGELFAEGTDVLGIDEHGLVESVTTFLDRVPVSLDPTD